MVRISEKKKHMWVMVRIYEIYNNNKKRGVGTAGRARADIVLVGECFLPSES